MSRKKNFAHIPVGNETKKEIDELKDKLSEKIPNATYDELIQILLEKHKNLIFNEAKFKRIILKARGIII